LRSLYEAPWEQLSDLNLEVIRWLLGAFGITTPIRSASEWETREEPTDRLIDLCRAVDGSVYLSGPGGDEYLDVSRFESSGLRLEMQRFQHPIYRQVYEPFMPAMSAIDLLFCCGPESLTRLRDARAGQNVVTAA
jgi:hypothetical protein